MKNLFIKILSVLMAFTLIIGMGTTVNALSTTDTVDVTIVGDTKTLNGTISAYKVIEFNYDYEKDQPKEPAYKWNSSVAKWLRTSEFSAYVNTDGSVTDAFMSLEDGSTDIKKFVDKLAKAIRIAEITPQVTAIVKPLGETEKTFNDLDLGAYLFLTTDSIRVYSPAFTRVFPKKVGADWVLDFEGIDVIAKSEEPKIKKDVLEVDGKKDYTYAIGDTVTYLIHVTVPQFPTSATADLFTVKDVLPVGLTNLTNLGVYTDSSLATSVPTDSVDFDSITNTWTFDYVKLTTKEENRITVTDLYIKCSATVDSDAYASTNPNENSNLLNKVVLTYSKDPYGNEDTTNVNTYTDKVKVYTYGLQIDKKLFDDQGNALTSDLAESALTKLRFEVLDNGGNNVEFVKETDGVYRKAMSTDSFETKTTALGVTSSGKIILKGLDVGKYTLNEIVAPDGFTLPATGTEIIIEDQTLDGPDGKIDAVNAEGKNLAADGNEITNNQMNLIINNYKNEFNLPATGGIGTMIFTIGGLLVMGAAVVLMVFATKKNKA